MKETKSKIINSTFTTVSQVGLEDTTTKRIARNAQISESIMYQHFTGKDDIIATCFDTLNSEINKKIMVALTDNKLELTLKSQFELVWNTYLNYFLDNPTKASFYDRYIHSNCINSSEKLTNNTFDEFLLSNSNEIIMRSVLYITLALTLSRDKTHQQISQEIIDKVLLSIESLINL